MAAYERDYIAQLNPMEQKILQIARSHLETSFSLNKSIGFQEWQAKQQQAKQQQAKQQQAVIIYQTYAIICHEKSLLPGAGFHIILPAFIVLDKMLMLIMR